MQNNVDFQSLLQLAVAMNVGFAALATIYGNSIARELRNTESLFETTRTFREEAIRLGRYGTNERALFRRALELKSDVVEEHTKFEAFLFGPARFVALTSALVAYLLLFVATFSAGAEVSSWVWVGAIGANGTFLCSVVWAYTRSVVLGGPLKQRRHVLDRDVSDSLLGLMNRMSEEEKIADPSNSPATS